MRLFVDTHVRRLQALRRAGIVERPSADCWLIPENFEVRATAYDAGPRNSTFRSKTGRRVAEGAKAGQPTRLLVTRRMDAMLGRCHDHRAAGGS